jgi:hypothetical protein
VACNLELRNRISELQVQLLEFGKLPIVDARKLVQEILSSREKELLLSRKEVKVLTEQVAQLKGLIAEKKHNHINAPSQEVSLQNSILGSGKMLRNVNSATHMTKENAIKVVIEEVENLRSACKRLEREKSELLVKVSIA